MLLLLFPPSPLPTTEGVGSLGVGLRGGWTWLAGMRTHWNGGGGGGACQSLLCPTTMERIWGLFRAKHTVHLAKGVGPSKIVFSREGSSSSP